MGDYNYEFNGLPLKIRIQLVEGSRSVNARATLVIADMFAIDGITINHSDSKERFFVSMPRRAYTDSTGKTQYADIAYPITAELRHSIGDFAVRAFCDEAAKKINEKIAEGYADAEYDLATGKIIGINNMEADR